MTKRRKITIEDKAKFLREYDRATHGDKKNVLAQWEITATYVARWREELARHTGAPTAPKPNLTGDPLSLDLVALYAKMAKESLAGWYMDRGQLMDDRDKYLVIDAKEAIDSARAAIFKLVLAME